MFGRVILVLALISLCLSLNENEFPKDFLFGTATSSYQIEGAWNVSGKGENIWDRLTHRRSHLILDGSNGDIACDSYNHVEEDVKLIKNLGVDFYRFSLSWSRILPNGLAYKINPDGIRYYNKLIDLLIENNITPFVTLFHWDTPQFLEDLGGFTNEYMVDWFEDYARVAFENFGDRVKWWLTFNEPKQTCYEGYGQEVKAPAYNSSGIGDYLCNHNLLKAHARAYHLYKNTFKAAQNGSIGITLDSVWTIPKTQKAEDIEAAERKHLFTFGVYADPIFHPNGDYPKVMKDFIGERSKKEGFKKSRLPEFTPAEVDYIKGTSDFFGLNHYTSMLVENVPDYPIDTPSSIKDSRTLRTSDPSWSSAASPWLKVVPEGFKQLLIWIKNRYGNVDIYITENGYSDLGELDDQKRIDYYQSYLSVVLDAMYTHNVSIKAYTAWSVLDNFEWQEGYVHRFGLYHVDFSDPQRKRTPKASVNYLKSVFANRKLVST